MSTTHTDGGAAIQGDVNVSDGDFVNRDQYNVQGDLHLHASQEAEPPQVILTQFSESSELVRNRYLQYDWNQPFDADEYRKSAKATSMLYDLIFAQIEAVSILAAKIYANRGGFYSKSVPKRLRTVSLQAQNQVVSIRMGGEQVDSFELS